MSEQSAEKGTPTAQDVQEHLYELIADHPMWIDGDGEPLDYSPEREGRIGDFLDAAALRITALYAPRVIPPGNGRDVG